MKTDIAIVGGGIVGLAMAREAKRRWPDQKITVFEKEPSVGLHASGRNSGVLHAGFYYSAGSLKARLCAQGAREMAAYCEEHGLPLYPCGKVIVPQSAEDDSQIDVLLERGRANNVELQLIDDKRLAEIEPEARSATGRAIYSPGSAVVAPHAILNRLVADLDVHFHARIESIDPHRATLKAAGRTVHYGLLINTAGVYADVIARAFGLAGRYTILPFKGRYFQLKESSGLRINGLIYCVPDLRFPFLGVHYLKTPDGKIYLGPTSIPAFGRENYSGLSGLSVTDTSSILYRLLLQYSKNEHNFRTFVHREIRRLSPEHFAEAAARLTPRLKPEHLAPADKVGIRAQLFDRQKNELVMDFLYEKGEKSLHILNAVSPAFTSSFPFARLALDSL